MPIVDADTHVDETEATWEYLREHEEAYWGHLEAHFLRHFSAFG